MNHGKILWLGVASLLVASLTMVPILNAQLGGPTGRDSDDNLPGLGAPQPANRQARDVNRDATRVGAPPTTVKASGRMAVVEIEEPPVPTVSSPVPRQPEIVITPERMPAGRVEVDQPLPAPAPLRPVDTPIFQIQKQSPYTGLLLTGQPATPKDGQATDPAPANQPAPPSSPSSASLFGLGKDPPAPAGSAGPVSSVSGIQNQAMGGTGAGDLLSKSNSAAGVEVQRRSPLVGDPRVEGLHFGQIITQADGGYWFPARVDLDSVISKLNSDNINNISIIKGPFSVRYGPGFSFLDVESLSTPRFNQGCFDAKGSTSLNYRTNAGQSVQQNVWGGNSNWGFRLSYDGQSANDYSSGNGTRVPSGYNNHFVNFAYGIDLSKTESLEVKYLHVQQSNVIFPGLLTDINGLTTDGFTGRFVATEGPWFDRLALDAWVNNTLFNGDSANQGTRNQIPQLDNIFPQSIPSNASLSRFGPVRLDINTNGKALSYGARETTTWGDAKGFNISLGVDIRVFTSNYNEYDAFNYSVARNSAGTTAFPANLGIPNARMIDPGIFLDTSIPYGEDLTFKLGGRVDFASTQFLSFGPNVDQDIYNKTVPNAQGTKDYFMFAGFAASEYKLSKEWTVQTGYGYAQRPPTLTELYTGGAFLGLIQNGLNSIFGNPNLSKEQMHQIDFNVTAKYETFRSGFHAFYAFVPDYITYNNQGPFTVDIANAGRGTTLINKLQFANTKMATMYGFDAYAERDVLPWLTPFATLNFVEAWDQSRDEALPGIAPLSSRLGVRFHEAGETPRWGIEYFARMVADQNLAAISLGEQRTGGFTIHNLRAYWQARENILLLAGVENFGDRQYREHLDLRTGVPLTNGVFQPGINFYFGTKISY